MAEKDEIQERNRMERYAAYSIAQPNFKKLDVNFTHFELNQYYQFPPHRRGILCEWAVLYVTANDLSVNPEGEYWVKIEKYERISHESEFTKLALRHFKLRRLLRHQNIIGIDRLILPPSRKQFIDAYAVSENMDTDLFCLIRSNQILTDEHVKFFLYQILRGLKYIHSARVAHNYLSPRSLRVNANCDLKITRFYFAKPLFQKCVRSQLEDKMDNHVYSSPQILLGLIRESTEADMWSVACIFAQMLLRETFLEGRESQVGVILDVLGAPSEEDLRQLPEHARSYISKLIEDKPARMVGKDFAKLFPFTNPQAIDLLQKMLAFNPQKRMTVQAALKHPYLHDLHLESDEPFREPINPLQFEFETQDLTIEQLKDLLYQEVLLYHFEDFGTEYKRKLDHGESLIAHVLNKSNPQEKT